MKNLGFKLLYIITLIIMALELGFAVKENLFTDIAELPTGVLERSISSPLGHKTLNIYLVKNNLGVAVRGEIATANSAHNIFWQTGIDSVDVVWLDDETVVINEIPLNANDTFGYDCRRGYSLFDDGALAQNFTKIDK